MRTTTNIDDDVFELARGLAESQKVSIGKAVSILMRRGAQAEAPLQYRNGFPVASVAPGTGTFGLEEVDEALDAGDAENGAGFLRPATNGR